MSDHRPDPSRSTRRGLKWAIFLGATAVVIYLCLRILTPFLNVLAWSAVLAITFHPLHRYLTLKTGHVSLSALICSALVIVAFVLPLLVTAGLAIDQFLALGTSLQQTFSAERGIDTTTTLGRSYDWAARRFGIDTAAVLVWIQQHANELTRVVAQYAVTVARGIAGAVVSFIFIIFAMFLMFRDGDRMVGAIPDLLPFERTRSEELLLRIRDVIYGGVYGVVVIGLIQGGLAGGMFWALGVPSAALWGLVTVLTSLVPVVGAAAVWVPAVLYLVIAGEWPRGVVLLLWGTFVISGVDNFLRPRLVGERVGLSELVVFFGVLGGLQVFGILGIVLGPVVFAIAAAIVDVLSGRTVQSVIDAGSQVHVTVPPSGSRSHRRPSK